MTRRTRDLIVVGASAGGVEALRDLAAGLPGDLPASVLVALHLPPDGTSVLAAILDRAGPLPSHTARDGVLLEHGTIYVAPPGRYLLVVGSRLMLSERPAEHGRRQEINALFASAARAAGPRVTGVLLSGVLDDGVAGLVTIVSCGGAAMVQDPAEARYPSMPLHALRALEIDHILPAHAMGGVLGMLSRQEADTGGHAARRTTGGAEPYDMLTAANAGRREELR